jgi:hypothetical protein
MSHSRPVHRIRSVATRIVRLACKSTIVRTPNWVTSQRAAAVIRSCVLSFFSMLVMMPLVECSKVMATSIGHC